MYDYDGSCLWSWHTWGEAIYNYMTSCLIIRTILTRLEYYKNNHLYFFLQYLTQTTESLWSDLCIITNRRPDQAHTKPLVDLKEHFKGCMNDNTILNLIKLFFNSFYSPVYLIDSNMKEWKATFWNFDWLLLPFTLKLTVKSFQVFIFWSVYQNF